MKIKINKPEVILFVGLVVSLISFLPPINSNFFSDDNVYIIGNKNFERPITEIWKYFFIRVNNFEYLPVRDIFYRIQYEIFGENPVGYRIINYILYVLCCLMVYVNSKILLKYLKEKFFKESKNTDWMAVLISILFAVHPAHVESVVWISGLKDLLSGSFLMLSLYTFLKALLFESKTRYILSFVFFLIALLSKATVLPFIAVVFLLSYIYYDLKTENLKSVFLRTRPFLITGVIFLIVYILIGSESKILAAPFLFSSLNSIVNNFYVPLLILGYLVRIALFPINLRLIYDLSGDWLSFLSGVSLGITIIVLTIIAIKKFKKIPVIAFGLIWFIVFATPYLQLVPYYSWSLVSERYLFLSILGLAFIISELAFAIRRKYLLIGALFLFYFLNTLNYSIKWRSEATLTENNARLNPGHKLSQLMFIENFLMVKDKYHEAYKKIDELNLNELEKERLKKYVKVFELYESGRVDEIAQHIEWLEGTIDLYSWQGFLNILGTYYQNKGDFVKAIEYYYNAMIYTYTNKDRNEYAEKIEKLRHPYMHKIDELKLIVRDNPNSINAIGTLANLQLEVFLLDEAEENYYRILKLSPNNPIAYYNLGLLYSKRKDEKKAVEFMEKAVALGFKHAFVFNNLGLAYNKIANKEKAEEMFLNAINTDKNYWFAYVNIAKLYALKEEYKKAVQFFEKAKQLATEQGANSEFIDSYLSVLKKEIN